MKPVMNNIIRRINRHVLMLMSLALMITLFNCSGSSGPAEATPEKVTEEQAIEAIIQVIREAGLTFPSLDDPSSKAKADISLFGWDYLDTEVNSSGTVEIQLWLGEEGHIIPKPEWQKANPDVCSEQGRYMRAAITLLEFSVFPDSKEVQLNLIDVDTGKIEESVWVSPDTNDPNWLVNGIREAWDKMNEQTTIKDATGPCGEMKENCTATITYSGGTVSFSADDITTVTAQTNKLGIGFLDLDTGIYMYLFARSIEKNIHPGTYFMDIMAHPTDPYSYITLSQMVGSDLLAESYDTKYDPEGPTGYGQLNITSIGGGQIEGTFSATLFSESGKKASITDGKFKIMNVDYEF